MENRFQMFGIFFLLIYYEHFNINFGDIGLILIFISIVFSLISSYKYLKSVSGVLLES
jgi:hypothetical protein